MAPVLFVAGGVGGGGVVINEQIVLNNMLNYDVFAQMNGLNCIFYALHLLFPRLHFFLSRQKSGSTRLINASYKVHISSPIFNRSAQVTMDLMTFFMYSKVKHFRGDFNCSGC